MDITSQQQQVERNFRWNFSVNIVDISFIMFGLALVSRDTVIPALISKLTDSPLAIGVMVALYSLGLYLPQLIGAGLTESLPRKKPFVVIAGGLGERVPYLLCGLVVLLLAERAPTVALILLLMLLGISGAAVGVSTPAWFDMIAKVIPVHRRGLFTGLGHGLGALMGVAGGFALSFVLERWPFPQNFALLFILAFAAMMVSLLGLSLNREPVSLHTQSSMGLRHYLARLPGILRADRNFTNYITASTLVRGGTMATAFFLVYASSRFAIGGSEVGLLTSVLIGSQALLNLFWGLLGDRFGHKASLVGGALMLVLAMLAALFATSWAWVVVSFALMGASLAADSASFLTIIPEFCHEADRPTYIGLANTLLAPMTVLAPVLGGWLSNLFGYGPAFVVAATSTLAGALMLIFVVRDPRHLA